MWKSKSPPEMPNVGSEISVEGFVQLSQWLINTVPVLYRSTAHVNQYGLRQPGASVYLTAIAYATPARRRKNPEIRPPSSLTVTEFEVFVCDDGTDFGVAGTANMTPKQKDVFEQDSFHVDAFDILRDYCQNRHHPLHPADSRRQLSVVELSTITGLT